MINSRFLLLSCIVLCSLNNVVHAQYSKLVVFGDSLSDTGNIASVTLNFPYPFYQNRISNGPVAADLLASSLGLSAAASLHLDNRFGGYNYAVGGANINGSETEDLTSQVDAFLNRVGNTADQSALYFVMIGGNDVRAIRSISSISVAHNELDAVLDTLLAQLQRLINAGARALLVSNVANIARIPETIQREPSEPGVISRAQRYSLYFNQSLLRRLGDLARSNQISITQFDLYSELETLINNKGSFGFRYADIGCFNIDGFDFHPDCNFGTRFDRFVFFDNIHPTAETNRLISEALIRGLPDKPFAPPTLNIAPIISLLLGDD